MKLLGLQIGLPAAVKKERDELRRARAAAQKRAVQAQGRLIDELTLAFINDVKRKS